MLLPIREHMAAKRIARFWSRVSVAGPDECWLWQGRCTPAGYGVLSIEPSGSGKTLNFLAHRVAKTLALGRDLTEPLLRHSCNVEPCCNPGHLIEGDHMANYEDSVVAGTAVLGIDPGVFRGVYGAAHPASRFGESDRQEAIRLFREEHATRAEIARIIGCHRETVARWLYDAFPQAFNMPASMARMRRDAGAEREKVASRLRRLRDARIIIAERTAELAALAAPPKSC